MVLEKLISFSIAALLLCSGVNAQVVINEGSNRNYSSIADEDSEYPDWIEIYNAGLDTVHLLNYTLSDKLSNPTKWAFPDVKLAPGEFRTVFCSGKDRKPITGFTNVHNTGSFNPVTGWNTHNLTTPFYWDGTSNLLINTCSYNSTGYTSNSVFNQTATSYPSTVFAFQDGSPASCWQSYGNVVYQRPNMKLNGVTIGTGTITNSPYDYPAPYGNWYWGAKNQMLIQASELTAAGLTAGYIESLAFSVVSTDPSTVYDYIDINMKMVSENSVSSRFQTVDPNNNLHTNFKISKSGENIYLYSPSQVLQNSLFVNCSGLNNGRGSSPDAAADVFLFHTATPGATNNQSGTFTAYLLPPVFSVQSGIYQSPFTITIDNPNGSSAFIYYTTDGSDPTTFSTVYDGTPIQVESTTVLKAIAVGNGILPSSITTSSYFLGIEHSTPIISVITDNNNLYGPSGIFDNWWLDWQRPSYVDYFDSTQQLIFSQNSGMQMDGGAGGSRSNPQHSFRLEFDNSVLGDGPVDYQIIPNRPNRTKYSNIYLRNGSNQYLVLPYKDASQVMAMGGGANNYFSAWRPVTVYINGSYFGLYELREKFDTEYFKTLEDADADSTDILTLSYWYGGVLRPVTGSVDSLWASMAAFNLLDPADTSFWDQADQYFDMTYYNDYIIAESWIANNDWPGNNIKIYRSDKTNYRWRFCLIDLELSLAPNGWTDCYFDHINYMMGVNSSNPYLNIWWKGIQNGRFRNYFINRYADLMNTSYSKSRLSAIENNMFNQMATEMSNEFARWGDPNTVPEQMTNFYNNHLVLGSQLRKRTTEVRNHIQSNFTLPNQVDVTLDIDPPGAGKIHISTISPDSYPWEGVYFNGLPVKIEAIPNPGFTFLHWENNPILKDTLSAVFNDTLKAEAITFSAHFADFTSLPSLETASDFNLYPNPASTDLYLTNKNNKSLAKLSYQVIDLNGRIIKSGKLISSASIAQIDIQSLPASLYLLRITDNKGMSQTLRFMKASGIH
ncbi:MAG: CotH kinase family protein [Bacteroidales bacterium]|nr:CotH kinase family protein [Bacteroidales bacterium]